MRTLEIKKVELKINGGVREEYCIKDRSEGNCYTGWYSLGKIDKDECVKSGPVMIYTLDFVPDVEYWIDAWGNKWDSEKYTLEEAHKLSRTLKDCENCVNSSHLTRCKNCINSEKSSNCEWCVRVKYCDRCYQCDDCVACNDCKWCLYCKECRESTQLTKCSECRKSKKLTYCNDCSGSTSLTSCRDCHGISNNFKEEGLYY